MPPVQATERFGRRTDARETERVRLRGDRRGREIEGGERSKGREIKRERDKTSDSCVLPAVHAPTGGKGQVEESPQLCSKQRVRGYQGINSA